jgi:fibronectin type 3 domain-containing protein
MFLTDATYLDEDGTSNDTYSIKWFSAYKESSYSTVVSAAPHDITPPESPSNVTIQNVGDGSSVVLSWTNPLDPDFAYVRIYRSAQQGKTGDIVKDAINPAIMENGTCQILADENSDEQQVEGDCFIDEQNILDGVTYYYTVVSVDANGNESPQRIISPYGRQDPFS